MMMKHLYRAALLALLAACGSNPQNKPHPAQAGPGLVIKGSETELEMVRQLRQAYLQHDSSTRISLAGGGSEEGLRLLLAGEIDMANASRKITPAEMETAQQKGIKPVPVIFAVDVVAVITHSKLGIDSLSVGQLGELFSGQITNWKTLGGPNAPVHLYGRDDHSGTQRYFGQKVLDAPYAAGMKQFDNYRDIVAQVAADPCGIGYVSLAHLMQNGKPHPGTWAVYLYVEGSAACSPYEKQKVYEGLYPLTRPLYQYTNGNPAGAIKRFIDFELSDRGQEIIGRTGFYPINDFHRQINRKMLE